jgi:hypothetical protein
MGWEGAHMLVPGCVEGWESGGVDGVKSKAVFG